MFLAILIATLLALFLLIHRKLQYWQKKNVKVPPYDTLIGHTRGLVIRHHPWKYVQKIYQSYKDEPYWGMYEAAAPRLFLRDLDIIKEITVKHADSFMDRRFFPFNKEGSEDDLMFSLTLLHEKGEKWKHLRSLLSPTFTSGKIKAMFTSIDGKAEEFVTYIDHLSKEDRTLDIRNPLGKFTLSVIAKCAFGLELPVMREQTEFDKNADTLGDINVYLMSKVLLFNILPSRIASISGMQLVPGVMNFFFNIFSQTRDMRKKDGVRREDFMDLLSDCMEESNISDHIKYKMSPKSMVGQSVLFLLAGYDTTANTLGFVCFFIAKNENVQEEMRNELSVIYERDGEFNYANLMDAKYLDAVISESLRMCGPVHSIERNCTKTHRMFQTGLTIEQGTTVIIPVYSIHHDPDLWENPEEFVPERFLPENKDKIKPYSYMPFGSGPRNCIGMRFAMLEMKILLAKVIMKYRLSIPEGHEELVFNKGIFMLKATDHGIRIKLDKI